MQRKASVIWKGSIKAGGGEISTDSGVLNKTPYSFSKRFGDIPGTNPEELIAAAHASCFAMAVSAGLSQKGFEPTQINVTATVSLDKDGDSWKVSSSNLNMTAQVPNINPTDFQNISEDAKKNCPISKLLNTQIKLEARLEGGTSASQGITNVY